MVHNREIIAFIKDIFGAEDFIPLHKPYFAGNEKKYLNETIDSTYVSSVGEYVNLFEKMIADFSGAKYAVATVNGTNALYISLLSSGVKQDDEVLSQALTFVATPNAISYINATPVFIDVDKKTMGMSPVALLTFLENNAELRSDGFSYNVKTGKKIAACVPMHTFGFPLQIDEIAVICNKWNIILIEDAAESLGSYYKGKHTGTFGKAGVFSFNGNKIITCGGGGAIITDDENIAKKIKHITTQAKVSHPWRFIHDEIGYNYRMPNLNAALACAQLEQLEGFLIKKRRLAEKYSAFFKSINLIFTWESEDAKANFWLNAVVFKENEDAESFLEYSNSNGVMTRPIWDLMNTLPMYKHCQHDGLVNSIWLAQRVVNIPSSVI